MLPTSVLISVSACQSSLTVSFSSVSCFYEERLNLSHSTIFIAVFFVTLSCKALICVLSLSFFLSSSFLLEATQGFMCLHVSGSYSSQLVDEPTEETSVALNQVSGLVRGNHMCSYKPSSHTHAHTRLV